MPFKKILAQFWRRINLKIIKQLLAQQQRLHMHQPELPATQVDNQLQQKPITASVDRSFITSSWAPQSFHANCRLEYQIVTVCPGKACILPKPIEASKHRKDSACALSLLPPHKPRRQ